MSFKFRSKKVLGGLVLFLTACGGSDSEVKQTISVPRGVHYLCTKIETVEFGKLDPAFCLFDELGVPGQRIYKQTRGTDCTKVTYDDNGNIVSRERQSMYVYREEPTLKCSTQTF